jgi:aconitase B
VTRGVGGTVRSITAGGAVAGGANTGNGGDSGPVGATSSEVSGLAGGSGVIILAVPTSVLVTFSGGVTQTSAIVGANRVYTVTATSTTDETVTIG